MAKEEVKTEETKETTKKSNKGLVIILIVVAVLIGLVLVGRYVAKIIAQKAAGSFLSGVTGQKVDIGGGGKDITVKTDKGQLNISGSGELPADFPKDFPVYPGAKVTGSFSTAGTGSESSSKGVSVVWETADDAAKVGAYFKAELPKAGYTVTTDYSAADSTTLTFEKGPVSGFMGVTKGSDNKTAISVTIGSK